MLFRSPGKANSFGRRSNVDVPPRRLKVRNGRRCHSAPNILVSFARSWRRKTALNKVSPNWLSPFSCSGATIACRQQTTNVCLHPPRNLPPRQIGGTRFINSLKTTFNPSWISPEVRPWIDRSSTHREESIASSAGFEIGCLRAGFPSNHDDSSSITTSFPDILLARLETRSAR